MIKRVSVREKRQQQEEQKAQQENPQTGQGFRAYTGSLKEDKQKSKQVAYTKITIKIAEPVADLLDKVYGKKKVRKEAGTKQEFVSEILNAYLEKEEQRLEQIEIQELQEKLSQQQP